MAHALEMHTKTKVNEKPTVRVLTRAPILVDCIEMSLRFSLMLCLFDERKCILHVIFNPEAIREFFVDCDRFL